jgi:methionyl-tRNA formyltransferase
LEEKMRQEGISIVPNIIFWGTSEFAVPALNALLREGYSIAAVVTTSDKPTGRKQILTPPPIKACLMKHKAWNTKIKILQPEKLDEKFMLRVSSFMPDVFVVSAYGKMIPADILAVPKYGALNIHPSLLPLWRGPSPIQYTILNGDMETGVPIMKVDEQMDHGPILAKRELGISNFPPKADPPSADKFQISKTTYPELHDALAKLGAELLVETLPKYLAGEIKPVPQNEPQATYSKLLKKEDGHIDWSHSAEKIERMARALNPWPGVFAFWEREGRRLKIDILRAQTQNASAGGGSAFGKKRETLNTELPPGMIKNCGGGLCVQTENGFLEITELQLEGKRPTDAKSFLNGHPEIIGQTLT